MVLLLLYLIGFYVIITAKCDDYCQPNYVIGDLPDRLMNDLYQGIIGGEPEFHGCDEEQEDFDPSDIRLWYNDFSNQNQPILLDWEDPRQIGPNKYLVVLVHGWLCNITSDLMPELKDAYLTRYQQEVGVIRVEYTKYTNVSYARSYCQVPKIAQAIGKFLCDLYGKSVVKPSKTHVLGHSLGAQLAGFIGKQVQAQCSRKVQRVTGLDPARPIYQNVLPSKRLSQTDGVIVDVIHTNQKQAGFSGPCGTVDFYPNGGYFQPNCMRVSQSTSLQELKPLSLDVILRSHLLAVQYYVETILHENFKAASCTYLNLEDCTRDVVLAAESVMGEHYPKHMGAKANYVISTNGFSPFCQEFDRNGTTTV